MVCPLMEKLVSINFIILGIFSLNHEVLFESETATLKTPHTNKIFFNCSSAASCVWWRDEIFSF